MNGRSRSAAGALLALGILTFGAILPSPAPAASSGTPDFIVEVAIEDSAGRVVTSEGADHTLCPLTILADVTLAEGRPDSPNTTLTLSVNEEALDRRELGPLYGGAAPCCTHYSYCWTPPGYGQYEIRLSVQNGPNSGNRTVQTISGFSVRSSDLRLSRVFADRSEAVIGITEVSISADICNLGNDVGTASVAFLLDGQTPLGTAHGPVGMEGERFTLRRVFSREDITEGAHAVTASLTDRIATKKTTGKIEFGFAGMAIADLNVSPAAQYEGREVVLSARIVNHDNADRTGRTVEFLLEDPAGGPSERIGSVTDITVLACASVQIGLSWTVPAIPSDSETRTVWAVLDQSIQGSSVVTILKSRCELDIELLEVPDGIRVGDTVTLSALVTNAGALPAEGIVVDFYDGNTSLASIGPFDLPSGASNDVHVSVRIPGAGDAVHDFSARARDASIAVSRTVGHKLAPANITIAIFRVDTEDLEARSGSSVQELLLVLVLQNTGELPGTAGVDIVDGKGNDIVRGQRLVVQPGCNLARTYWWMVEGGGAHTAAVTVTCQDWSETANVTADIPYRSPEMDLPPLVAAGTAAVLLLAFIVAYAARVRNAGPKKARPGRVPAREPVAVTADRRVDLEPWCRKLYAAPPRRTGK